YFYVDLRDLHSFPTRRSSDLVSYQVENTRVGQSANFDKLTLDVWTNGSIRPEEAVSLGAKVLTEHLNIFVSLTEEAQDAEIMVRSEEHTSELQSRFDLVCRLL